MKFKATITELDIDGQELTTYVEYSSNPDTAYHWLVAQEKRIKYFINSVVLMENDND